MSTFFGLELGRRALAAFRRAIDISGHNVSNVNTPGYHRQRVIFNATAPYALPSLSKSVGAYHIGTGVEVSGIKRFFDVGITTRINNLLPNYQYQKVSAEFLSQIEGMEALRRGVFDQIGEFFNAFQEVANFPENITIRAIAIQKGVNLTQGVTYLAQVLRDTRSMADKYIQQDIEQVNSYLKQIRSLNVLIQQASAAGDTPNDLLDQRDYLLSELSKFVNIQTQEGANNSIIVYIGGRAVVQDDRYIALSAVSNPANSNFVDIKFSDNLAGPNVALTDGKLKGLLDTRDSSSRGLLFYKQQLDLFATDFVNAVNLQHTAGFDLNGNPGGSFFVAPFPDPLEPALNMQVAPLILDPVNGPLRIAVASNAAGVPGDGSNALAISRLANSPIISSYTPADFFTRLVADLGANLKGKSEKEDYLNSLLTQLENLRDSVSAVSLDEEATMLLEYEKSFSAAARIVNIYNDIYDVILNLIR